MRWAIPLALVTAAVCADDVALTPLEDFEDVAPWVKGDPNTDLTQKEVAIAPSTGRVHEGKQSLAFMVRVDWTPKPGEEYPKGWPMVGRDFEEPQDWSAFDEVRFWLFTDTKATIPTDRALRCGFGIGGEAVGDDDWYTIPGIKPHKWQSISVPLDPRRDWSQVTNIRFYVAEQWYQDGDRIDFYIDDMQLGAHLTPRIHELTATSRIYPRGEMLSIRGWISGPFEDTLLYVYPHVPGVLATEHAVPMSSREISMDLLGDRALGTEEIEVAVMGEGPGAFDTRTVFARSLAAGKRSYLSLISFYNPTLFDATAEGLAVLNDSAYEAVAIRFWGGYDTDPVPAYDKLKPDLERVRESVDIDIWPWVFSNRIVGRAEDATGHSTIAEDWAPEYFERIRTLDIDDEAGALSDLLTQWRHAVRAAREWGSPGIVLDLETYNNYKAYQIAYVAERRGESARRVIAKCESIGADLARICEEEYPECIVWSLFSHLERGVHLPGVKTSVYSTAGHITLGFLKYADKHGVPCKYLCGGEVTPGYYNPNVEQLKKRIADRDATMAELLGRFPDHFRLAGTISPYHDHAILTWWIKDQAGDDPQLKTIEDFQPMFRTLFDAYDWVWIYASSAADTQPYNPTNSARYSAVLNAALDESAGETN